MNTNSQARNANQERALDDLLGHIGWLRSLASQLVADQHQAEDLVQSALTRALEQPPGAGRPIRPWLATVMRNLWRSQWRGVGPRRDRESDWARPEGGVPSSASLVESVEQERRLAGMVLELEEPLREVLLMRYWEGLQPKDIARRTGQPGGTVRWRLKRGLELMRERLDRESDGDRSQWLGALAPLVARHRLAAGAGSASLTAGLVPWLLAAAGCALLLFTARSLWTRGEPAGTPGLSGADALVASASSGKAVEKPEQQAQPAAAARRSAPVAEAMTQEAGPVVTQLVARLVDGQGRGLAGATLRGSAWGQSVQEVADGRGRIDLSSSLLPGSVTADLLALAPGLAHRSQRRIEHGVTNDLGDLVLMPAARLRGRVESEDGQPLAGAWLALVSDRGVPPDFDKRLNGPGHELVSGEADGGGRFELQAVPSGVQRLFAKAADGGWGWSEAIEIETRDVDGVVVVVQPRPRLSDLEVIVQGADGKAVTGGNYLAWAGAQRYSGNLGSDGHKRFGATSRPKHFRYLGPDGSEARAADIPMDQARLVLQVGAAVSFEVQVQGPDGEALENASLSVRLENPEGTSMGSTRTKGGVADLPAPSGSFYVQAEAGGFRRQVAGPFTRLGLPAPLRLKLEPLAWIRGRVLHQGQPLPGARVGLARRPAAGQRVRKNGVPTRFAALEWSKTDRAGEYGFQPRKGGTYVVFARTEDGAVDSREFEYRLGQGTELRELEIQGLGKLQGRLERLDSGALEGTPIAATRMDGEVLRTRTDELGGFDFEGLVPGDWRVYVDRAGRPSGTSWSHTYDAEPWNLPEPVTLRPGSTAQVRLVMDDTPVALRGQLRLDGAPCEGALLKVSRDSDAQPFDGQGEGEDASDDQGQFLVSGLRQGTWSLSLWPQQLAQGLVLQATRDLLLGGADASLDLASGELLLGPSEAQDGLVLLGDYAGWRWSVRWNESMGRSLRVPKGRVELLRENKLIGVRASR